MDKYFMWIHYERLHNHNKAKHNKNVCIGYIVSVIHIKPFRQPITDLVPDNFWKSLKLLKLWKMMQSQVELMRTDFKFEAPIIQVQIITYITY